MVPKIIKHAQKFSNAMAQVVVKSCTCVLAIYYQWPHYPPPSGYLGRLVRISQGQYKNLEMCPSSWQLKHLSAPPLGHSLLK